MVARNAPADMYSMSPVDMTMKVVSATNQQDQLLVAQLARTCRVVVSLATLVAAVVVRSTLYTSELGTACDRESCTRLAPSLRL